MMESFHVNFEWIRTGGIQHVFYRYPFAEDWNRNSCTREDQGVIYVKKPESL